MPPSLLDFPAEILDEILRRDLLDIRSLARTSCCCSYLNRLLLPRLLKQISFTSDEWSCTSALLAVQRAPHHVQSLNFTAKTLPIAWSNGDEWSPSKHRQRMEQAGVAASDGPREENLVSESNTVLHEAARKLLSGRHTPGMATLTVRFELLVWHDIVPRRYYISPHTGLQGDRTFYWYLEHDSQDTYSRDETEFLWLARLNAIWHSIAANRLIKNLRVHNLVPKAVSAMFEEQWKVFLNQLESLEISVAPAECDGGSGKPRLEWSGEMNDRYGAHQWLGLPFTKELRHLELRGSASPLISESLISQFVVESSYSRHLTSMQLHSMEVGLGLHCWLSLHAERLRIFELYNCWSGESVDCLMPVCWGLLFRRFLDTDARAGGPIALTRIVIQAGDCHDPHSYVPLSTPQPGEWPWHVNMTAQDQRTRERPHGGPYDLKGKRFGPPFSFLMSSIDVGRDYRGGWGGHIDPERTLLLHNMGGVMSHYEKLLAIVERNNARSERS